MIGLAWVLCLPVDTTKIQNWKAKVKFFGIYLSRKYNLKVDYLKHKEQSMQSQRRCVLGYGRMVGWSVYFSHLYLNLKVYLYIIIILYIDKSFIFPFWGGSVFLTDHLTIWPCLQCAGDKKRKLHTESYGNTRRIAPHSQNHSHFPNIIPNSIQPGWVGNFFMSFALSKRNKCFGSALWFADTDQSIFSQNCHSER